MKVKRVVVVRFDARHDVSNSVLIVRVMISGRRSVGANSCRDHSLSAAFSIQEERSMRHRRNSCALKHVSASCWPWPSPP